MLRILHKIPDFGHSVDIAIFKEVGEETYLANPLIFEKYKKGGIVTSEAPNCPTLSFNLYSDKDKLRSFIMEWIRLADTLGIQLDHDFSKVEKQALEYHLKDMRALVFKKEK